MSDINQIYGDMWRNAEEKIRAGTYEMDPLIGASDDTRKGTTVLSYLNKAEGKVSRKIMEFLDALAVQEPEQYYYPENELHLTVLSVVSCVHGFMLEDVDQATYQAVFNDAVKSIGPLEIQYRGITASPGCVLVQGFPLNEQLHQLRENLRRVFRDSPLYSTIDSRYKIATAHSTIARFQAPLRNHSELLKLLEQYRTYDFGVSSIHHLDLVFNNWYQQLSHTHPIAQYSLAEAG